ncbi:hypothetical protein Lbir_1701 [Legionella birminghamensis]|uniref:Uncharacterized protein n=1 Tax=Legionella birminghamensis TaxID=28083 RepID=A0A378I747_9GAMM|nr:hypothetical protein [Legionella birminghamensis]KTC71549.1 hypothetical protein Lbir_1701 [Legionella birminghamensis]STX30843.1 Uncharacterised protein [Legionella birminghamensis]
MSRIAVTAFPVNQKMDNTGYQEKGTKKTPLTKSHGKRVKKTPENKESWIVEFMANTIFNG